MTTLAGRLPGSGPMLPEAGLPEKLHPLADPVAELEQREVGRLVKDELLLLPEKYRSPVVLCYFEGRTHEEAAHQLGYPAGSMSRRLKRAQALLRRRLIHRGFSFAIGFLVLGFAAFCGLEHLPRPWHHRRFASVCDVFARAAHRPGNRIGDSDRPDRSTRC